MSRCSVCQSEYHDTSYHYPNATAREVAAIDARAVPARIREAIVAQELAQENERRVKAERERDEARADLAATQRKLGIAQKDVSDAQRYADSLVSERDEARRELARWRASYAEECAEVARLRHDPRADARPVIEEWKAKAERAWSDAAVAQERLEQAVALLRETRPLLDYYDDRVSQSCIGERIDAFLDGQPAPAKPVVDDAMVERAWHAYVRCEMDEPNSMRAALVAALEGRT